MDFLFLFRFFLLGTVAAGLKAGKPTIVVSFFGDQFFWGQRVAASGVGEFIPFKKLTTENVRKKEDDQEIEYLRVLLVQLTIALRRATTDKAIRDRAAEMGKLIDSEDGVSSGNDWEWEMMTSCLHRRLAVEAFHRHLDVAYVPPSFVPDSTSPYCKQRKKKKKKKQPKLFFDFVSVQGMLANCKSKHQPFSLRSNPRHHCRYFSFSF